MSTTRELTGRRPAGSLIVDVSWPLRTPGRAPEWLARAARHAARAEGLTRGSLSIAVVGTAAMARLHWLHMRIRGATDVLTFDFGTDADAGLMDGEIVVCAPVAQRAAAGRRGSPGAVHPVLAELALYVVHGVLHLGGHDDLDASAAGEMHAHEDALLTELGLGAVYNPAALHAAAPASRAPTRRAR